MTREEILHELKEILIYEDERNREAIEKADESTALVEGLGLASVSLLYLVISIEETFGIRFENAVIGDFKTVGDTVDAIEALLRKKEANA